MKALGEYILIRVPNKEKLESKLLQLEASTSNNNYLKGKVESVGDKLVKSLKGKTIYFSRNSAFISIEDGEDTLHVIDAKHALLEE